MSEFSSFLPSLNQALKARQDRENGLIWADNIYEDRIYLGNGYDAKNYQQLTNHHITHIINCSANDVPNYYENYIPPFLTPEIATSSTPSETVTSGTAVSDHTPTTITPDESTIESRINENQFESSSPFQYINLDIQDFGQDKGISRVFQSVLDSVNEILLNPINKILIHCANGSNRSATIAIVVLMKRHGWNLSQAWNYITKVHPQTAPLRDNRQELLKYEYSIYHKNSMFESEARLIDLPTPSCTRKITIRLATGSLEEAAQCLAIYTPIVYDTTITFEIIPPTVEEFSLRMIKCMEKFPWILAYDQETNEMVGYAYAGVFKERAAYRWSVESSIYVSANYPRCGIATKLYDTLFTFLKVMNIINVVAVIALPNERSVKLHEKYNFKTVGIFTKIGYKHEEWIDVIYMQKVLQEPRYHSLTIDEDENNNTTTTTAGSATNGDGNTLDNEIEMVEPIAYPECSQQLHDILKLLE